MPEIRLIVKSEQTETREVAVTASRFGIGRGLDNELVINDPALSRRHSLIESDGDIVFVTDCGSQNGTYLNGDRVSGTALIRDGDVISLGSCDLTVRIRVVPGVGARKVTPAPPVSPAGESESETRGVPGPVVAAIAIGVILLVAAVLIIASLNRSKPGKREYETGNFARAQDNRNAPGSISNRNEGRPVAGRSGMTPAQMEKAAAQVIRRISNDENPYIFPAGALNEIAARADQHSASAALPGALRSVNQGGAEIAADARREGLEPSLVIYSALAETEGGQRRDARIAARQLVTALSSLRPYFGCEQGDCTLIMLAAYRIDPGTRRSHPLLATMRRLVHNPLTERNIWNLHERGGIDDNTYNFVLDVVAYGVIAQQPEQFGIAASALAF